jgi:hypothetical protein
MAESAELLELRRQTRILFDEKIKETAFRYTMIGFVVAVVMTWWSGSGAAWLFMVGPLAGYACGRMIARKRFLG